MRVILTTEQYKVLKEQIDKLKLNSIKIKMTVDTLKKLVIQFVLDLDYSYFVMQLNSYKPSKTACFMLFNL